VGFLSRVRSAYLAVAVAGLQEAAVRANGANGIMIYQASAGIQSNMVAGNRGDGIVFEAAPR
jgi:hypothetical protein